MTYAPEWSMVAPDAREALSARRAIRSFLAAQADEASDLDAVELIVGELVGNVVKHAPGAIGLHVSWCGAGATLIVADRGPGIPSLRCVPDAAATGGRGLFLVEALALRVRIENTPGAGARVVVDLPVRRHAELVEAD